MVRRYAIGEAPSMTLERIARKDQRLAAVATRCLAAAPESAPDLRFFGDRHESPIGHPRQRFGPTIFGPVLHLMRRDIALGPREAGRIAPDLVEPLEPNPKLPRIRVDRQRFAVAVLLHPSRGGAGGQVGEMQVVRRPIRPHAKAHDIAAVAQQQKTIARHRQRGIAAKGGRPARQDDAAQIGQRAQFAPRRIVRIEIDRRASICAAPSNSASRCSPVHPGTSANINRQESRIRMPPHTRCDAARQPLDRDHRPASA